MEIDAGVLRNVLRAIDNALAEIEAGVADGDIDDSVLYELDEAHELIKKALNSKEKSN